MEIDPTLINFIIFICSICQNSTNPNIPFLSKFHNFQSNRSRIHPMNQLFFTHAIFPHPKKTAPFLLPFSPWEPWSAGQHHGALPSVHLFEVTPRAMEKTVASWEGSTVKTSPGIHGLLKKNNASGDNKI